MLQSSNLRADPILRCTNFVRIAHRISCASCFVFACLRPVSSVPCVVLCLFVYVLCLLCPVLPVSELSNFDCPYGVF